MKQKIFSLILLFAASSFVFGQPLNEEQTVKHIIKERIKALLNNEPSVFSRYLSNTYIFTAPDASIGNKQQHIKEMKSMKFRQADVDDISVMFYGNTAIGTYQTKEKGTFNGEVFSGTYRWMEVFVKQKGRWQIVATQGTTVPSQK